MVANRQDCRICIWHQFCQTEINICIQEMQEENEEASTVTSSSKGSCPDTILQTMYIQRSNLARELEAGANNVLVSTSVTQDNSNPLSSSFPARMTQPRMDITLRTPPFAVHFLASSECCFRWGIALAHNKNRALHGSET